MCKVWRVCRGTFHHWSTVFQTRSSWNTWTCILESLVVRGFMGGSLIGLHSARGTVQGHNHVGLILLEGFEAEVGNVGGMGGTQGRPSRMALGVTQRA